MPNENEDFLLRLGEMAVKLDAIAAGECNDLSCVNSDNLRRFRAGIPSFLPFLRAGDWAGVDRVSRQWIEYWLCRCVLRIRPSNAQNIPA